MTMKYGLIDFLGNTGVLLLMIAYLMLQLNRINSNGLVYSLLNLFGASLIIISLITDFNLSAFVMEVFWLLISLIGVVRYFSPKTLKSANQ
jgi:hypothetical protein